MKSQFALYNVARRTPRGVRGLKPEMGLSMAALYRRTPRGVRGLKLSQGQVLRNCEAVAPREGCVD